MVAGSHAIFCAYGLWLPNNPRGSWSDFVGAWEPARYARTTKTHTRRSVAAVPHDCRARRVAKSALEHPPRSFHRHPGPLHRARARRSDCEIRFDRLGLFDPAGARPHGERATPLPRRAGRHVAQGTSPAAHDARKHSPLRGRRAGPRTTSSDERCGFAYSSNRRLDDRGPDASTRSVVHVTAKIIVSPRIKKPGPPGLESC